MSTTRSAPSGTADRALDPRTGPRPLTAKNYLAYATGDAAGQVAFTMSGMFLTLYYTNVVGISGAVIGTMFLVLRFVDAFTDLYMGRVIDRQKVRKLGKFRPLLLGAFIPLLVVNWLMYAARLIFPDQSVEFYTVYMYVTYLLMGSVFYTICNVTYGSLAAAMSNVPAERAKLAVFRMVGAAVMILTLSWVIAPSVQAYRDDPVALQGSLALTVGLVSLVAAVLYAFTVWGTVEQAERNPQPITLAESFRTLKANRPLQVLAAGSVAFVVAQTVMGTLGSYVALYVQNDGTYIAINATAQTVALFVIAPAIPSIVRRLGKQKGFIALGSFMYLGALLLWLGPLETRPWVGSLAFFLLGLSLYGVSTLMWALEADTVEYGEWKTGARTEGTTYAVFSFCRKLGQALGGFLGGYALVWAGFRAADVAQGAAVPDHVAADIAMWAALFIMAGTALSQIIMHFFPLNEAKYLTIVDEIADRRRATAEAHSVDGLGVAERE